MTRPIGSVVGSAAFQGDLVDVKGPRFANPTHVLARTRITAVSLATPLPCFQDGRGWRALSAALQGRRI